MPLLCLHGGPGFSHDYLEELGGLGDRRRVYFYDQLGCGKSDRPTDKSLWEVDRFVEEVATVREALGLERLHLYGSSWGGMLAMQYVLDRKPELESLVLAQAAGAVECDGEVSVAGPGTLDVEQELPREVRPLVAQNSEGIGDGAAVSQLPPQLRFRDGALHRLAAAHVLF